VVDADEQDGPESEKRRQIMAGAREVFLQKGYEGASMEAIAKAAKVSKGTLYVYFDSKDLLFAELIRTERKALAENLLTFDSISDDFPGLLRRIALFYCDKLTEPEHVSSIRMVIGAIEKFPQFGRIFYESGPEKGQKRIAAIMEMAIAAGKLRPCDPKLAARHFIDLCTAGLLRRALFAVDGCSAPMQVEDMVDHGLDVFFRAYGA